MKYKTRVNWWKFAGLKIAEIFGGSLVLWLVWLQSQMFRNWVGMPNDIASNVVCYIISIITGLIEVIIGLIIASMFVAWIQYNVELCTEEIEVKK